jgi:carboxypeptidase C (cathepsin A)
MSRFFYEQKGDGVILGGTRLFLRGFYARQISAAAGCLVLVFLAGAAAGADDKPPASTMELPARVETHHTLQLAGRSLDYQAVAETIGLTDTKGDPTASIFTISYVADVPAGSAPRPVAFVFNGGPGAASVFLHLGALGPRVVEMPGNGAAPNPPAHLVDNPASWLAFTDLVFIDPVGTGFSHAKGKDENPDKQFWNVRTDLNSLAAVLRRWLTRHERWRSPVYLVGESYGGLRAAALPETLARDVGITVNGVVLVSPALDIAILHPEIAGLLAPAFELPSLAASAAALAGKPPADADSTAAEHFALSDYLVGLAAMSGIPRTDDPFIGRVAALTGVPDEIVRRERGRISAEVFAHEIRRPQGEVVSIYDGSVRRPTTANTWDDHAGDPVLDPSAAAFTAAFGDYAATALGYHTEQPYRTLAREVSRQWNWDGTRGHENGLGLALSSLQNTLLAHPATKVLVANGSYDLVTPYLSSRWLIDQLAVPPELRSNIRLRVYEGGHMMYMRAASRAALSADAAALFAP